MKFAQKTTLLFYLALLVYLAPESTTYEFYLASEYAFAFADNKKVAGYNDKNSNNWNNAKHH